MSKTKKVNKSSTQKKEVDKKEVKQIVQSMLRGVQELKINIVQSSASIDYAGSLVACSAIAVGDSDITRDGDRVCLAEWTFRWVVNLGDASNLVRCILLQYIPDNTGGAPAISNILQTIGTTNAPISYKSIDYVKVIKILYDWTVRVDTYHPVELVKPVKIRKFHDKQLVFANNATTGTNQLYVLFISDSAAATHPSVQYYSTVRYTDS